MRAWGFSFRFGVRAVLGFSLFASFDSRFLSRKPAGCLICFIGEVFRIRLVRVREWSWMFRVVIFRFEFDWGFQWGFGFLIGVREFGRGRWGFGVLGFRVSFWGLRRRRWAGFFRIRSLLIIGTFGRLFLGGRMRDFIGWNYKLNKEISTLTQTQLNKNLNPTKVKSNPSNSSTPPPPQSTSKSPMISPQSPSHLISLYSPTNTPNPLSTEYTRPNLHSSPHSSPFRFTETKTKLVSQTKFAHFHYTLSILLGWFDSNS